MIAHSHKFQPQGLVGERIDRSLLRRGAGPLVPSMQGQKRDQPDQFSVCE